MSDLPQVPPPARPGTLAAMYAPGWQADADIIRDVVERLAVQLGERPGPVVRAIEDETPAGRFIVKLLKLAQPTVRAGRPVDNERFAKINAVVDRLRAEGLSETEATRRAPTELAKLGILGNGRVPKPLTQRAV